MGVDIDFLCVACMHWWVVCAASIMVIGIGVVVCICGLVCSFVYTVVFDYGGCC